MDDTDANVSQSKVLLLIGLIIVGIIALMVFDYRAYFYSQIRQNKVRVLHRSTANRQLFHQEIAQILSVDHRIDAAQQAVVDFKQNHPRPWDAITEQEYSNDEKELQSLQQIRQSDIADYNAASTNPDKGRDRDGCLPATIDPSEPTAIEEQRLTLLHC